MLDFTSCWKQHSYKAKQGYRIVNLQLKTKSSESRFKIELNQKSKKINTMMRPTVEVETSHRLFSAPRGDTVGLGLKRWAIQVKKF